MFNLKLGFFKINHSLISVKYYLKLDLFCLNKININNRFQLHNNLNKHKYKINRLLFMKMMKLLLTQMVRDIKVLLKTIKGREMEYYTF